MEGALIAPNALIAGAVDGDISALQTDVITAAAIQANAIGASELATDAIGDAQIATGAIASTAFASGAINDAAIATDAITNAKIAAGAITSSEAPNLDAAITTRATPAQVNTEVLDVMNVDTITLPGQVAPPLNPTHREMDSWMYKMMRNRTDQTATLFQLFADNETTVDAKATVSDDATTAIKQEIIAGP